MQILARALTILYNDFDSDYKTLLDILGKCTMEVKRLKSLGLEVFKTLNNLNPSLMQEISHGIRWLTHRPNNIQINVQKTTK